MKVMGLFAVTLAVCLVSMTLAQPFFLPAATIPAGTTAAALNTAGTAVVLSGSSGTLATLPIATAGAATIPAGLVYAGVAAKKLIAGKLIFDAIANRDRRG